MGIDGDPAWVGLDADRFQAEPLDTRTPAGGHEQSIAAPRSAIVEFQNVGFTLAARGDRVHAKDEFDSVMMQNIGERFPQWPGLAREDVGAAFDEHDLATQSANSLRHLHANRPTTEYEQPVRDGLHAGHLAIGPNSLKAAQAGHGRDHRVGSRGHDHVFRRVADAVDIHNAWARQPPATAN